MDGPCGHSTTLAQGMGREPQTGEQSNYLQVCGLSAIYCCYTVSNEPVSTQIPSQWPPYSIPLPAGLDKASLDCASGNCTESALGPAAPPTPLPEGSLAPSNYPLHMHAQLQFAACTMRVQNAFVELQASFSPTLQCKQGHCSRAVPCSLRRLLSCRGILRHLHQALPP